MATVYARSDDSYVTRGVTGGPTWASVRGDIDTVGTGHSNTVTNYFFGIHSAGSGKGGGAYIVYRSYFPFDLSLESGTVDSATFSLYSDNTGSSGDYAKVIAIEATALAGSTDDYGNVFTGASGSTTLGTAMSSTSGITISTLQGYHLIPITGDTSSGGIKVINDAIGSATIVIGVMAWYHDYSNNAPSQSGGASYTRISITYANYSGTSRDPLLEINYEGAAVTNNATFFGANF